MIILVIIGIALVLLGIFLCANVSDFGESSIDVSEEDIPNYTYPIV